MAVRTEPCEMKVRVGTAGWAIPAGVRDRFPIAGGGLERYAARLGAVEINSTFYRRHRTRPLSAGLPPRLRTFGSP